MFQIKGDRVVISVRNLVEFVCNSGSIDNRRGGTKDAKAMLEGARLHRKLQAAQPEGYRAEVTLKKEIAVSSDYDYTISLEGRADGIITRDDGDVTVDEIKCIYADIDDLKEPVPVHLAQAMCYAYLYSEMMELEEIEVMMTYCQIETEKIRTFRESYGFCRLKEWFDALMERFCKWTDFWFDSYYKRQESIAALTFPFAYRKGQKLLVSSVYKAIEGQETLFIQAPTGTGKTISAIFPAVKAMGDNLAGKLFYLTAKTITRTVAVDTFSLLAKQGLYFRRIVITAKDKICPQMPRACNPLECPYANGHFDRVNDAVYDLVTNELEIDSAKLTAYAVKHQVCPFEMSLDAAYWCDGVICDYNYVFDPNVYLKRFFGDGVRGDYIFLTDEAHNLVERGRAMYSASLIKEELLELKRLVKEVDKRLVSYLEKCNRLLLEYKRECENYTVLESQSPFVAALERVFFRLQTFFEEHKNFAYMERVSEIYLKIRHYMNISELADEKYVLYTTYDGDNNFVITQYCADPSTNIKNCVDKGCAGIFFSATLLPVNYYKEMLMGDADCKAIYAQSVFEDKNRLVAVAADVSSRFRMRGSAQFRMMAHYIVEITGQKKGNYMVFFPSFYYMEQVMDCIRLNYGSYAGQVHFLFQKPSMSEAEREEFLNHFKDADGNFSGCSNIGMCVMGGIFSEGIDLKKEALIGAVIVGTGLPMVCNERQILKSYFDEHSKNGYAYAYTYPGMNKVCQAAGRVIRTVEDVGVIALLDERFLTPEYGRLFPREWSNMKLCSSKNMGRIIGDFWRKADKMS